jgi:hypothetical protein
MHLDALLEQGASQAIQDEIIALSEEYHIITPYTSLLVLESDADRERFKVNPLPMRDAEKCSPRAASATSCPAEDAKRAPGGSAAPRGPFSSSRPRPHAGMPCAPLQPEHLEFRPRPLGGMGGMGGFGPAGGAGMYWAGR